ncbi:hypothetical protein cypCar_00003198 [Cyprinus carpio]|nr:hypothetical protein cypCar_00003198 [Cyprinus carpio]
MTRYTSPVNPAVFPHLTVVLMAIGMFFTAWFFVYEVTSTKYTRDLYKELLISLVASLFMGFGVLFLLLLWNDMNRKTFQDDPNSFSGTSGFSTEALGVCTGMMGGIVG